MQDKINKYLLNTLILITILAIIYFIIRAFFIDVERIVFFTICLIISLLFLSTIFYLKFKNVKLQSNFLIFFFSSVISLYLLEIMMFKLNYNKSHFQFLENIRAAKINKIDFDDRNIYEFYKYFKNAKNKNSVLAMSRTQVSFENKITQTLGGIGNKETILCNEMGYWVTYKSDRFGFNNPDELWDKKLDVLIIGDSYGLGLCVNQDQNFAGAIRKKKQKISYIGWNRNGHIV